MEVRVRVKEILQPKSFNTKNGEMKVYGFVGTTLDQYPKNVKFDVMGEERWEKMKQYVIEGTTCEVGFDASSREYNGKWYTSLNAYRVLLGERNTQVTRQEPTPQPNTATTQPSTMTPNAPQVGNDDLPF